MVLSVEIWGLGALGLSSGVFVLDTLYNELSTRRRGDIEGITRKEKLELVGKKMRG